MDESLEQGTATALDRADFSPRRALAAAREWASARRAGLACALLLSVMSLNMLAVVSRKSITVDEIVMIPAAYYHLVVGNFHLVQEHPPLSKILAAVPLLFVQPNEVAPERINVQLHAPTYSWAYQETFWEANREQFEAISFWSRVGMIALPIALGVLIFVFARELFGARAAVLAVALYAFEPTVLAHGRVVQTDVPAAFGYLLLFYALYRYWPAPDLRRAAWVGAAAGIAILAKFSMLLAGPVLFAAFVALVWRAPRSARARLFAHAAITTAVALFVIHAAYFFHSRELVEADARWVDGAFPSRAGIVLTAISVLSYVLPTDFVLGIFWQVWHNGEGHPAALLGAHSRTGWWYYFPVAFALKTTLPFLLLSLASLAWGVYVFVKRRERRFAFLLAAFAVYTAFVMLGNINIGVRYYLPAFPFLFILSGALLDRLFGLWHGRRAAALVAAALVAWVAVEAVRAYPDQMTYFNQLASSRPHWWYLSDSNVEWGEDARELSLYLRARGETRVRAAFLGGLRTMRHYGVEYVDLLSPDATNVAPTRYAAVGASFLNGSTVPERRLRGEERGYEQRINFLEDYRGRQPEAVFGGSIYLFREGE